MDNKDLTKFILLLIVGFIVWKIIKSRIQLSGSNEEEWEIIREPDGKLKKIIVHRNVKQNLI